MSERDEFYMQRALALASEAEAEGEVPVGAVLVYQDEIIGEGRNHVIGGCDPSLHAEVQAIRQGAATLGNYRLLDTTLYVTLEPCPMCAGLLVHSRIKRLVYGAADPKTGAAGSLLDLTRHEQLNHHIEVSAGVLGETCGEQLSGFFKKRRALQKALKRAATDK
ncbi:tRNA adenosine(34) deaminase TadA [Aliidiomarina halalkaliphila]|uniref:tRNA-specific adenosine deaminase n=1 Tax=Aliidiomarina halalkaliphila TaxID=2593535 RepID=A0A552X5L1_9GAMM|nr:tRNA adenosine(34) deaminase TadA [Aliidiomarina halalkaliphila]TRW50300.1 tRNA adenosine(34) deaminase TadA [Aliidiomarina halalkaliphila]